MAETITRAIWSTNIGEVDFSFCIDSNDKFVIKMDGKSIMKYNDDTHMWMGVKNGKIVKIQWPSLRDIANQYLVQ